ncbi:MAG: hypothetical protein PW786_14705 [Arachidicoccus sp.]|nr:hypothetical protein [Arachidicoccus sp.]
MVIKILIFYGAAKNLYKNTGKPVEKNQGFAGLLEEKRKSNFAANQQRSK